MLNFLVQVKGLSKEEIATRSDLVSALPDKIQSIPDGSTSGAKVGGWTASGSRTEIRFDSTSGINITLCAFIRLLYEYSMKGVNLEISDLI